MKDNVLEKNIANFTSYIPTEISNEAKKLLKLYWTLDNWIDGVQSDDTSKIYAKVFQSQLNQLVEYYFAQGVENKAKLAATLFDAARYAEQNGLSRVQAETVQAQLIYFQHVNVTMDDISQCDRSLWAQGIYPRFEMPDWETAILDH